jgi:predicted metal-dependent hydrolase
MPEIDYQAMDEEIDKELAELLGKDYESDDSPDESGTELNNESDADVVQTTQESEEVTQHEEPTVAESRYKEAVRAMNKAQQELAEYRKQSADRDQLIQQLQSQVEALQSANNNPAKDDSEDVSLDDLASDYPEIVGPLLKEIKALTAQVGAMKGDVDGVKSVADNYRQREAQTAQERHVAEILAKHPDAFELRNSDEFEDWLSQQAPIIQHAISQGSSQDVNVAFDLYKSTQAPKMDEKAKPNKLDEARRASSPNVKGNAKPEQKTTFTLKQIEKMSRDEFIKHEAAIDEALARGEIY